MRLKKRNEHTTVALTVIYFLGSVAVVGTIGSFILVWSALLSDNAIDSAAVALIGQFVSINTLALGALGAMLSSTSPKPFPPPLLPDGTAAPIAVEGVVDGEPVTTTEDAP